MENMTRPIRRHHSLQPLSRDHHHALLLVWKIRKGISKGIEPSRIERYADWFFEKYLAPHVEFEERYVYPILGGQHSLTRKALEEHRKLESYFQKREKDQYAFLGLANALEFHIRFEERELFNCIQAIAAEQQLEEIAKLAPDDRFKENGDDPFWER